MLSGAELADIKAYHVPHYVLAVLNPLLYFALLLLFIRRVQSPLYARSERLADSLGNTGRLPVVRVATSLATRLWGGPGAGTALLFAWGCYLFFQFAFWPLGLYFGYVHERHYQMWHASLGRFVWESAKSTLATALTLGTVTFGMYGLARRLERWWLVLGLTAALLLWVSASIDPFRGRLHFSQTPLPAGVLRTRLDGLLRQADVPFQDLVVEKSSDVSRRVQGYFAGQGPTRTIVLNDALLSSMTEDEIVAVVAHEAGHVHELRWPGKLAASLTMLLFLYLTDRLFRLVAQRRWLGIASRADVRTLPLLMGFFSLAMLLSQPISGFFSRERELAADRYAVNLTRSPEAFRRMLMKASSLNREDPDPPRFIVWMGASHPTLRERLLALGPADPNHEAVGGRPPSSPSPTPADSSSPLQGVLP